MQSQDYLKTQYSEWLQRRSSSKGLLASLLQSEPDQSPDFDRLSVPSVAEDSPFVPQFLLDVLSLASLRETLVKEMERAHRETTVVCIIRQTVERLTNIRLGDGTSSSLTLDPHASLDAAAETCYSSQGGLVLLSADHSLRIATSSPPDHRRHKSG